MCFNDFQLNIFENTLFFNDYKFNVSPITNLAKIDLYKVVYALTYQLI